jgi:hypothetical protein
MLSSGVLLPGVSVLPVVDLILVFGILEDAQKLRKTSTLRIAAQVPRTSADNAMHLSIFQVSFAGDFNHSRWSYLTYRRIQPRSSLTEVC